MTKFALIAAFVAGATTLGMSATRADAVAVSVNCPDTTSGRFVTLTTDPGTATCLYSGDNPLNGNLNDTQDGFLFNFGSDGWVLLDKSDEGKGLEQGTLSGSNDLKSGNFGSFVIDVESFEHSYSHLAIGFKTGGSGLSAFVFKLPDNVFAGSWTQSFQQDLSHANLYGIKGDTPPPGPQPIPLPAAVWLLLSGIGGLGAMGWRKRRQAAA